ncbi:4-hydroxy-tetrahydrodipicolinate reductase [Piscinibacter koreensis]|uniref:4-hydroxy-tetrahydrodipicolinate reductase n=1 Tax=Piscinibacter koreensis TaxID=2742824 RepID=A0A7Y6TV24_9BURK|nr:4-hydroxy-tetrahydrodipicolinate reductase [Schlegelella koreensis]NUZ04578.1 4-hydroxy-tetrahydrodipicolinate reductase [Schlegelella koreensis]
MSGTAPPAPEHPRPLRVAVAGASGRMGRMLIEAIVASPDLRLTGALDIAGPSVGQRATAFLGDVPGPTITDDIRAGLQSADTLIDFTRPAGTLAHLGVCRELGVKAVIGTTGFDEAEKAQIAEFARDVAIVMAPNMSVGVNVVLKLLAMAAKALGDGYDVEVIEAHHRHKIDAPSGTALKMGEVVAAALGRDLKECAVYARDGYSAPDRGERARSTIGFSSIRGGDIVGDHTVLFAGDGERIEITHKSSSRATYAQGSLRAVRFLAGRANGLFGMDDVLGIAAAEVSA